MFLLEEIEIKLSEIYRNHYIASMHKGKNIFWPIVLLVIILAAFNTQYYPFGKAESRGIIQNRELKEASGLTASVQNPGLLWSHNDSGDLARIFLMDDSARNKAVYYLQGINARDWEEIGSMLKDGESYLLIGDIGDNNGKNPFIHLHVVKEPIYKEGSLYTDTIPTKDIVTYTLQYEDGPRDAESLIYDSIDQKLYIISKRELEVGIYETTIPANNTGTLELKKSAVLPYTFITSAAISTDGKEVLLKNLLSVYYWQRLENETIPSLLKKPAILLPYTPEIQGEAITFSLDGSGYYTLSEEPFGFKADLRFYPRL